MLYNTKMIKIVGNDLYRGGEKIGWLDGRYVRAHDGAKMGYFDNSRVYDENGNKLAYVEGDYLYSYSSGEKVSLNKVAKEVEGGIAPGIEKCAVYTIFGT